jgi:hypothetical protein
MYFERIPHGMLVDWWIGDCGRKQTRQAAWNRPTVSADRERMIYFE